MKTTVLLINLSKDVDRLSCSLDELNDLNLDIVRIEGTLGNNLDRNVELINDLGVAGCWHSHIAAYQYMVDHDLDTALIVEDDIEIVNKEHFLNELTRFTQKKMDLIQLGFISPHPISKFEYLYQNVEHILLTFLRTVVKLTGKRWFRNIKRINSQVELNFDFVPRSFLGGTHCYLIGNEGARKLLGKNIPVLVPADGFLRNLIELGYLDGGRSFTSLAGQRASLSTITGVRNRKR